jgi:hypothetical protein
MSLLPRRSDLSRERGSVGGLALIPTAAALIITLAIEVVVAAMLGYRSQTELTAVALVNVMTSPTLGFVYALAVVLFGFAGLASTLVLGALELAVVVVEWRLLTWVLKRPSGKMFVLSLTMNATSFGLGALIFYAAPIFSRAFN